MVTKIDLRQILNLATGLQIHPEDAAQSLDVVEWNETTLVFQCAALAAVGQIISLKGNITVDKKISAFEATGRILSVVPEIDKLNRFEIHLQQFDKALWKTFLNALRSKQARADKIFDSMREDE